MQWCAGYPDAAPTTTMGVARGGTWAWSPKYINSMCPPFCQFFKKVVVRLSGHGDAIKTQTMMVCLPQKFQKTVFLCLCVLPGNDLSWKPHVQKVQTQLSSVAFYPNLNPTNQSVLKCFYYSLFHVSNAAIYPLINFKIRI